MVENEPVLYPQKHHRVWIVRCSSVSSLQLIYPCLFLSIPYTGECFYKWSCHFDSNLAWNQKHPHIYQLRNISPRRTLRATRSLSPVDIATHVGLSVVSCLDSLMLVSFLCIIKMSSINTERLFLRFLHTNSEEAVLSYSNRMASMSIKFLLNDQSTLLYLWHSA